MILHVVTSLCSSSARERESGSEGEVSVDEPKGTHSKVMPRPRAVCARMRNRVIARPIRTERLWRAIENSGRDTTGAGRMMSACERICEDSGAAWGAGGSLQTRH